MKSRLAPLAIVLVGSMLVSCDQAKQNAENDELKRKLELLEKEQAEASAKKELDAKEEALAAKQSELQAALKALEEAKKVPAKETPNPGRAVVVEEPSGPDARLAIRAAERARMEAERQARALELEREALMAQRIAEAEAARLASQCQAAEHGQLERAFTEAQAEVEIAHRVLSRAGLSPRERGRAELAHEAAERRLRVAEEPYRSHMQKFHPNEWVRAEAARLKEEAQRLAREEERRRHQCQPNEHKSLERAYNVALAGVTSAEKNMEARGLSARQRAYAEVQLKKAYTNLAQVEKPFMDHLLMHHPDDYREMVANQARAEAAEIARARAKAEADLRAEEARLRSLSEAKEKEERARAMASAEAARRAAEALRQSKVCDPKEHQQLDADYKAAVVAFNAAEERAYRSGLNPKQQSYARTALGAAAKKMETAKQGLLAHLKVHHPVDHQKMLTDLAAADARRNLDARQRTARAAEEQRQKAEALANAEAEARAKEQLAAAAVAAERAKMEAAKLIKEKLAQAEAARVRAAAVAEAQAKAEAERMRAKAEAERLPQPALPKPAVCSPEVHRKLEAALEAAKLAREAAQKQVDKPGNPKLQGFARKALGAAVKAHTAAEAAFDSHLQAHHPLDWEKLEAERAAAAKKAALLKKVAPLKK